MSKKKNQKNAGNGTYALCITTGLIVGLGLGPLLGNVLVSTLLGTAIGALAAYLFNHSKKRTNK
jgi:uncharacterized membrane protein YccC